MSTGTAKNPAIWYGSLRENIGPHPDGRAQSKAPLSASDGENGWHCVLNIPALMYPGVKQFPLPSVYVAGFVAEPTVPSPNPRNPYLTVRTSVLKER
jgi:hypothetical protein